MPPTLAGVTFIVDENLLRFGKALVGLRTDVACFGQPPVADMLPQGIADLEWVPVVGDRGWVMITNDKRLRTRPGEAALAIKHRLKVVHLHGDVGHLSAWDQTLRFTSRWPAIAKHVDEHPHGPWWLSARRSATRVLSFEPGVPERG